jgi:hypothetical protein
MRVLLRREARVLLSPAVRRWRCCDGRHGVEFCVAHGGVRDACAAEHVSR